MATRIKILEKTTQNPLKKFIKMEQSSGIVLMLCAMFSLFLANSSAHEGFEHFLHTPIALSVGSWKLELGLAHFINDGLMAVFFLVVGLEIKRELLEGHLSSFKLAILPVLAALGGMLVPAVIYLSFGQDEISRNGWGIPMATDIAFSLAVLSLLGKRIPVALKVFLTALAIADDLGAVLVIAFFYTNDIDFSALMMMGIVFGIILVGNKLNFKNTLFYVVAGNFLWYFTLTSGVHATIAGVLLALAIPFYRERDTNEINEIIADNTKDLTEALDNGQITSSELVGGLRRLIKAVNSMSHRLMSDLHYVVSFGVMPLFALANTAVHINPEMTSELLTAPSLGIYFGLTVGKPLGISLFSWLAVKFGIANLPENTNWFKLIGVGFLAGIGFTMSFFVGMLAFPGHDELVDLAKISILLASLTSAVVGYIFLYVGLKKNG